MLGVPQRRLGSASPPVKTRERVSTSCRMWKDLVPSWIVRRARLPAEGMELLWFSGPTICAIQEIYEALSLAIISMSLVPSTGVIAMTVLGPGTYLSCLLSTGQWISYRSPSRRKPMDRIVQVISVSLQRRQVPTLTSWRGRFYFVL